LWLGAKIAGARYSKFGRAVVAAVASGFITWLVYYIFWQIPGTNTILGLIIGLILTIIVIKAALSTSFGKALLVWIFQNLSEAIAVFLGFILFSFSILG
jgi:hypothetical protein